MWVAFFFNNVASKNGRIQVLVKHNNVNILGLADVNVNWKVIPYIYQLHEPSLPWWKSRQITAANNMNDINTSQQQWGGLSLLSMNKISHRAIESRIDNSGLR